MLQTESDEVELQEGTELQVEAEQPQQSPAARTKHFTVGQTFFSFLFFFLFLGMLPPTAHKRALNSSHLLTLLSNSGEPFLLDC
jgi:hypothetical protein